MEYLDVVDENNVKTGESLPKDEVHEKGLWYREVIGIVINKKNQILLQKRAPNKKDKANMWEMCCGHVSSGEEPQNSLIRELQEEIGLKVNENELHFLRIEKFSESNKDNSRYHNVFSYIFFVKTNKKIEDFVIQEEEVSEIKYEIFENIKDMYINKTGNLAFDDVEYIVDLFSQIQRML